MSTKDDIKEYPKCGSRGKEEKCVCKDRVLGWVRDGFIDSESIIVEAEG